MMYLVLGQGEKHDTVDAWYVTNWSGTVRYPATAPHRTEGRVGRNTFQIETGYYRAHGSLWAYRVQGDMQLARCRRLRKVPPSARSALERRERSERYLRK